MIVYAGNQKSALPNYKIYFSFSYHYQKPANVANKDKNKNHEQSDQPDQQNQ